MYRVTCHVLLYRKEIMYSIKYRKDFLLPIYTRKRTHTHTHAHTHTYTCTHTHRHTHGRTHTDTHTHRQARTHAHTHRTRTFAHAHFIVSLCTHNKYINHSTIDRRTLISGVPGSPEHTSGV